MNQRFLGTYKNCCPDLDEIFVPSSPSPAPPVSLTMTAHHELLKDTTFGYLLRAVLGSKVLPHSDEQHFPAAFAFAQEKQPLSAVSSREAELDAERRDIEDTRRNALQRPHDTSPGGFSRTSTLVDIASYALDKSEKADNLLVGWFGPDDPDVSAPSAHLYVGTRLMHETESPKLELCEKGLGLIPNLLSHLFHLHWLVYLHRRPGRHRGEVSRQCGCRNPRPNDVWCVHPRFRSITSVSDLFAVAGYGVGPMLWAPLR